MKLILRAMKTILIAVTVFTGLLLGMGTDSQAATIISSATGGNWSAGGSWIDGVVPAVNDDVIIAPGSFITVSSDGGCASLVVASGATLDFSRKNFTVSGTTTVGGTLSHSSSAGSVVFSGTVTINNGGVWNSGKEQVVFWGGLINNGTFNSGTANHSFSGVASLGGIEPVSFAKLTITGTITNTGNLTVTSALAGSGTLNNLATGVLNIEGTSSIVTFANSGSTTITGAGAISNFTNTGTLNLNGTGTITGITNNAAGTINLASSGAIAAINNATATSTLNISAATVPTITTLTATAPGNTVNYTGAAQTGAIVTTYNNLTLSGSGAKTFATTPTVTGTLSMEGTATVSVAPTYGASATLKYNTATARTAGVEWITPFVATGGIKIANTGVITMDAAKTLNAGVPLTIDSGATLNAGVNTLAATAVNNSGTIRTQNTSVTPLPSGIIWNGMVVYDGAAQTVSSGTYSNLTLSGSGAKSIASGTSVTGNLSIAPSGTATASIGAGLKLYVGTLALGGLPQGASSYGATSSAAINKNDTYFAPTSGYIILYGVPIFTSAASTSLTYGTASTFTVTTDANPAVTSIAKSGVLPTGVSFKDNGDGTATIGGTPNSSGAFPLNISAVNNYGSATQAFALTVTPPNSGTTSAVDTEISVSPNRHLFGTVSNIPACGPPVTFTVRNAGSTPRTLGTLTLGGYDAAQYSIGTGTCSGSTLSTGQTCTVGVSFCPTSTGSRSSYLQIPSNDPETPVLTAMLYNHESLDEEAARRLPPVLQNLDIPATMAPGTPYTISWSLLGYEDDYLSRVLFFDCRAITNGTCGNVLSSNFLDTGHLNADSRVIAGADSWSYTNGGTVSSNLFNYSYSFTPTFAGNIVIRFFHRNLYDDAAGLSSQSLVIPGNQNPVGTSYGDKQGRKLLYTITP